VNVPVECQEVKREYYQNWFIYCQRATSVRLRNDLYCVGWGVKLYSLTHRLNATISQSTARNANPLITRRHSSTVLAMAATAAEKLKKLSHH